MVWWESLRGHCAQAGSPVPGEELWSPSCSQESVPWAQNSTYHYSLLHTGWPLQCCQRQAEPLCLPQMSLGNLAFLVKAHFLRVLLSSCKYSHGAVKETILKLCNLHFSSSYIVFLKALIVSSSVCFKPWNSILCLLYTLASTDYCKVVCKPELGIPAPP